MSDFGSFAEASVRTATPLLIASAGEMVTERAGVINVAMEGCIIAGAFAAASVMSSHVVGYGAAALAGLTVGALLAVFAVLLSRDQIVIGTALTMLALGMTGTLFRSQGSEIHLVATEPAVAIPVMSSIPLLGRALFAQPVVSYAAFAVIPVIWFMLYRTQAGLALRAVGDSPHSARAAGIRVKLVQCLAVLAGSALGGLAGGALVLAQAGSFAEGMSAGRGFLAIAIVALGRWRPIGVLVASLTFGAAMALQYVVQALGWNLRYELVLMIPYVLTLVALGAFGRGTAPRMLGKSAALSS